MLARLEKIEGVRTAETDDAGEYLRLSVRDEGVVDAARVALTALGYGAEPAAEPRIARWFGVRSVRELSLIEAGVIADRILAQVSPPVAQARSAPLRAAIVAALHACLVNTELTSASSGQAFRRDCVHQTIAAATPVVGATVAAEVGRLLDLDMREPHKTPRAE